jgi:uncharacterized protein (DUF1501 family)
MTTANRPDRVRVIRGSGRAGRVCSGTTRRDLLTFGGLGALGLMTGSPVSAAAPSPAGRFGQAKHVLLIYLFGGASQFETWDPKPDAPAAVRGQFGAIETNVSGIRISELAPKLARCADQYSLVRSVGHADNTHDTAMYTSYTGWPFGRKGIPPPSPEDRPAHGAILSHFRPVHRAVPQVVALGGMITNSGNEVPGQRGGLLGSRYDPFPVRPDPASAKFRVPELALADPITTVRFDRRRSLLNAVDSASRLADRAATAAGLGTFQRQALDLIGSAETHWALDIQKEDPALRDRYGRTGIGQRLLLARRLFEVGVPCVTVHWLDADQSWDYHSNNFPGHKKSMAVVDPGVAALLGDLKARGMLDETLVVVLGEFGRTAKVNATAGRDHWAACYSALLAGGGIQGGRVHGASDKTATYPQEDPVGPWDIAATVYHLMGVDPAAEFLDFQNRPMRVSQGEAIRSLL